jgi:hypothetical protein
MTMGLDYAGGRPSGWAIKTAGYDFVVRYLSSGGPSLPGKLLTPVEADDLRANDVEIVSNWETIADRMLGGYGAGVVDATAALAQVLACGGRADRPIYFSADWDADVDEQPLIDAYLRGAASVIGPENVGIYGGYWPVMRALDNGVARWAWQTGAWSGGNREPRAHLYQRIGYAYVDGVQCDVNEALKSDYGQWSAAGELTPEKETAVSDTSNIGDIREQLCGKGSRDTGQYDGWEQLGQNEDGRNRTVVDAVAAGMAVLVAVQTELADIRKTLAAIAAKVGAGAAK